MTINLSGTSYTQIKAGYDIALKQAKQWKKYLVQQINIASIHIQKDKRWAAASLVGANIIFFEMATTIARLVSNVWNEQQHYRELDPAELNWRGFVIQLLIGGMMTAFNAAFCEYMNVPLSGWQVAVISFSTSISYVALKIYYKNPDLIY